MAKSTPQARARRRGRDFEKRVEEQLNDMGVRTRRTGLSGQARGDLDLLDHPYFVMEVKSRPKDLLRAINEGLKQAESKTQESGVPLVVCRRSGRQEPIVVTTLDGLAGLL